MASALIREGRGAPLQVVSDPKGIIGTMFICPDSSETRIRSLGSLYTHVVSLEHCDAFIRSRMKAYYQKKHASRLLFPDELIQYLAWQGMKAATTE
ncbi:hypothetical protein DKM44_14025 [Deinococcus irradiatisoli]|uniref:Uncharacterized protein n=1 Tax=Deinococcus irradiatisoli TaxID=2202254 RepID=A0A2Z3JN41_9DEIO|nr:hypothetical protein DKM44_14025 [Deinococcus irradiatisoli]